MEKGKAISFVLAKDSCALSVGASHPVIHSSKAYFWQLPWISIIAKNVKPKQPHPLTSSAQVIAEPEFRLKVGIEF